MGRKAKLAYSRDNALNINPLDYKYQMTVRMSMGNWSITQKKVTNTIYYKLRVLPYKLKVLLGFKIDTLKSDLAVSL